MLIAVVTYFHPVFWAQNSFYHLTYTLDQSIRSKVNEGIQSWPPARRNGKVWASDLFRPGVYFQPSFKHCEKLNTLPNSVSLNFFIGDMGFRSSVSGTENNTCKMPGPLPVLSWDCQGYQSLLWSICPPEIQLTTLWFHFQPRWGQRISRGLGQRTLYKKNPG